MKIRLSSVLIGLIWLVHGCAVGPNYTQPKIPAPDAWNQEFVKQSPMGRSYERLAKQISNALKFMKSRVEG